MCINIKCNVIFSLNFAMKYLKIIDRMLGDINLTRILVQKLKIEKFKKILNKNILFYFITIIFKYIS